MLFNSYPFIFIFLPIAVLGYFILNHLRLRTFGKFWLIGASFYFYSYWNINNLPLLIFSILTNYSIAQLLQQNLKIISKKSLIRFGVIFNVGLLCFFKYAGLVGLAKIALPLGLSFFTLQQIAFLIDTYEGLADKKTPLDYTVFVSFFPQLISGPIVHYQHLMPQLESEENKKFSFDSLSLGIFIFCLGLTKKVLIAEAFSSWAKPGFDQSSNLDLLGAWKTSLSYTFQLYYDFSGYSDMAIGIGHMFNVKLPQNFNSPYRSKSVIEFWNRWHMTLGQFINTYLFTPLVRLMPKINFNNTMKATFLSMLIVGIWHGAGWTFTLYGVLHGVALIVNHKWKKKKKKLHPFMAWLLTFNFINISFVIFRAPKLEDAWNIYKAMLGFNGVVVPKIGIKSVGALEKYGWKMGTYLHPDDYLYLAMTLGVFYIGYKFKNSLELENEFKPSLKLAMICGGAFVFCIFGMNKITEFIYFNF